MRMKLKRAKNRLMLCPFIQAEFMLDDFVMN